MNNRDMPAAPTAPIWLEDCDDPINSKNIDSWGLTKREYFAGLAMQALLANPNENSGMENAAFSAVYWADELLAELEKSQ